MSNLTFFSRNKCYMYTVVSRYLAWVPEVLDLQSVGKKCPRWIGTFPFWVCSLHFKTNYEAPVADMATYAGLGIVAALGLEHTVIFLTKKPPESSYILLILSLDVRNDYNNSILNGHS